MLDRWGLLHPADDVAMGNAVADCDRGHKVPAFCSTERVAAGAARHEIPRLISNDLQGPLNPVVDHPQKPRPQLGQEGFPLALDRLADPQAISLFIDLNRHLIALDFDHFADQTQVAHAHQVPNFDALHAAGDDHRPGDARNLPNNHPRFTLLRCRSSAPKIASSARQYTSLRGRLPQRETTRSWAARCRPTPARSPP